MSVLAFLCRQTRNIQFYNISFVDIYTNTQQITEFKKVLSIKPKQRSLDHKMYSFYYYGIVS